VVNATGGATSVPSNVATVTVNSVQQVATPIASISSGTVNKDTPVTLSTITSGAVIYYTLDGSAPSTSDLQYTQPIIITDNAIIIRAIAIKDGMLNSEIASFAYTVSIGTSIVEVEADSKGWMSVTPNPARAGESFRVILSVPDADLKDCSIAVYSLLGEKVYEIRQLTEIVEVPGLSQGTYIVQLSDMNNKYRQTRKVIVRD
jgi:hypothetical protein